MVFQEPTSLKKVSKFNALYSHRRTKRKPASLYRMDPDQQKMCFNENVNSPSNNILLDFSTDVSTKDKISSQIINMPHLPQSSRN